MRSWVLRALFIMSWLMLGSEAAAAGSSESPMKTPPAPLPVVEVGDAPSLGPESAPVTIVEFADFECPYCAQASRALKRLLQIYPTQVRWVFQHYPLHGHNDAPLAHEAALVAHEQGKFWEMHDLLYANQNRLKRGDLLRYANQLNLDMSSFTEALDTRRLRRRVARDVREGRRLNVGATPTYFINGKRMVGARSLAEFRQQIETELAGLIPPAPPPSQ